jgi:hypothetical protein
MGFSVRLHCNWWQDCDCFWVYMRKWCRLRNCQFRQIVRKFKIFWTCEPHRIRHSKGTLLHRTVLSEPNCMNIGWAIWPVQGKRGRERKKKVKCIVTIGQHVYFTHRPSSLYTLYSLANGLWWNLADRMTLWQHYFSRFHDSRLRCLWFAEARGIAVSHRKAKSSSTLNLERRKIWSKVV